MLFWPSLRRITKTAGYNIRAGWSDNLAVWGRVPRSRRAIAARPNASVITFEDAFLRSVVPGQKTPPIGLTIDDIGVHFDCSKPSRLEVILQSGDLDDADLLRRAKNGRAFLTHYGLSKYNLVPRGYKSLPAAGYILVVDQLKGDASVEFGGANDNSFIGMLAAAKVENPGKTILIKTHPAMVNGKEGHFSDLPEADNIRVLSDCVNIHDLLEGAAKVYCVTSLVGFEAILAGHKPVIFGSPFYAGWGLSEDTQTTNARRTRTLSVDQLFAGAMILFPFWYDRTRRIECSFEEMIQQLLAESRHRWDGLKPSSMLGMRLWKRSILQNFMVGAGHVAKFHGRTKSAIASARNGGQIIVWARYETENLADTCAAKDIPLLRMEDGFLRSVGLGAELTQAASLVLDDCGIYYDATRVSKLETLIKASIDLPEFALKRAAALRKVIVAAGVTKYNLVSPSSPLSLPINRKVILVPGQVEDDASILKGAGSVRTNSALLIAVRAANPSAYIIYKPHPDVRADLRDGAMDANDCDIVVEDHDTAALIAQCDEVWTMTSLLGFEALLRGKKTVCYGTPFYAGWGLTTDLGENCERRNDAINLNALVHTALIDYPRYIDPISNIACTPELMVERLASGVARSGLGLRLLAKL